MSTTNGFIISITPTRLSVIYARRGRVQQAESMAINQEQWGDYWNDSLMRLDQPMRQLLSRFGGHRKMSAVVLYQSPTLTKQIYPFDQGGVQARDAARSKIREMVGLSDPVSVCALGGERGSNQPCMMLAYSDREETLRSIYALLNRCGVQASSMIPVSVASIVFASSEATRFDDDTAVLYLESDCSIIAHTIGDKLTLVRPSDLGYQKLVDSYRRVFHEKLAEQDTHEESAQSDLHKPDPISCLFKFGVPFQPVELGGIELRSTVLPCMAPVLQRIGIDVKQTIRFGIGSHDALKNLYICGLGAAIPGITKAINEHLELHVQPAPDVDQFQPMTVGGHGSVEFQLIGTPLNTQGLLPSIAGEERDRTTLNRALVAGCALAVATMGTEYAVSILKQQRIEAQMQNTAPMVDRVGQFKEQQSNATGVAVTLTDLAALITKQTDPKPQWIDPLTRLSRSAGDLIRIQEIRGDRTSEAASIVVSGYTTAGESQTQEETLNRFIEKLSASPAVNEVKLGATSRIELGEGTDDEADWGLQFSIRVMINDQESAYSTLAGLQTQNTDWIEP